MIFGKGSQFNRVDLSKAMRHPEIYNVKKTTPELGGNGGTRLDRTCRGGRNGGEQLHAQLQRGYLQSAAGQYQANMDICQYGIHAHLNG